MRIVIASGNIAQGSFRNQASGNNAGCADNALCCIATEPVRVLVNINTDTVHFNGLADITRYDARIVPVFFQVIVFAFGACISKVKRLSQVRFNDLIVWIKGKELLVKCFDMILCFYRDIVFPFGGIRLQSLAVCQDIYFPLHL